MAKSAELALILSLVDEVSKASRNIKAELRDIGRESNMTQRTLDGLAKIGFGAVVGAAGLASAAIGGAAATLTKLAKEAAPLEGIRSAFEAISDSAEEMLAQLRAGTAGMVSDRDLMLSYVQAAQLVGKEFADQLPDAMQYLSKISAATGQDMAFLMDSLVKGIGRASPMILDNLGIQVQLSEATARAAQMFGKEASALTEAEIKAGLQSVVMEKLAKNTESMSDVSGTASQMMGSLRAQFQNVKDAVGTAVLPAFKALLGPLAELARQVLPEVVSWFNDQAVPAIEKVAAGIGIFIQSLSQGRGPLDAFKNFLWTVLPPGLAADVVAVADAVGGFIAQAAVFVGEHAEAFKAALIAIGAVLAGAMIASGIAAIGSAIAALANPITLVIAAAGLLGTAWAQNWGGIQEKTQAVLDWLGPKVQAVIGFVQGLWAEHGGQITAAAQNAWQGIQGAVSAAGEVIQTVVQTVLTAVQGFWDQHGAQIMQVAQAAWEWIADKVAKYLEIIQTVIAAITAAIHGDWYTFGSKMREAAEKMWSLIREIFRDYINGLLTLVSQAVTGIVNWFRSVNWGQVGRSVIEGIVNGIKAAAGWLADAAREAAKAALDAAKGFLGIHSPSRVAMLQIGVPFTEGIAEGIRKAEASLRRQALEVAATLVPPRAGVAQQRFVPTPSAHKEYHLHIHSAASAEPLIADFAILEALA